MVSFYTGLGIPQNSFNPYYNPMYELEMGEKLQRR